MALVTPKGRKKQVAGKKKPPSKCREWCFTVFEGTTGIHPFERVAEFTKFYEDNKTKAGLLAFSFGPEFTKEGRPHLQCWLHYKDSKEFKYIQKRFPYAGEIKARYENSSSWRAYCYTQKLAMTHEEWEAGYEEGETFGKKHPAPYDHLVPVILGTIPDKPQRGKRNDKEPLRLKIEAGATFEELSRDPQFFGQCLQYPSSIKTQIALRESKYTHHHVQSEQIGTMSKRIDVLEAELKEERSDRKRLIGLVESIADRIGVDYQNGPLQKSQKTDNGMVLPFSVSYDHLKRNPRLVDVFIYFFDQQAKLGYYSEMQSNKLKSADSDRKKIIAKFARVKKIVKLMLMNIGSYPGKKPADPKLLVAWQEDLLKLGRQAENNIYVHFGDKVPHEKFNVTNVLTNRNVCKKMQLLKLPSNTPAEELQFFNS
jgi:hypothetical protein